MSASSPSDSMAWYNKGVEAAQSGNESTAVAHWKRALGLNPPHMIEVMTRRNLVTAHFRRLRDLPAEQRLLPSQSEAFFSGERQLIRLAELLEQPPDDLDGDDLRDLRDFVRFHSNILKKADFGEWILPLDETPRRLVRTGMRLAHAGRKDEALHYLNLGLQDLDTENPDHTEMRKAAIVRCASLSNDLGQLSEAAGFAREALDSFDFEDGSPAKIILQVAIDRSKGLGARVQEIEPGCTDPYLYASVGEAFLKLDVPRADKYLKKGLEWNAIHHSFDDNEAMLHVVHKNLGLALFKKGSSHYQESLRHLRKALEYGSSEAVSKLISGIDNRMTSKPMFEVPSKKSDCFIATAVCGSDAAPEVILLQRFRDQVLSAHVGGRLAIKLYCWIGPPWQMEFEIGLG